MAAGWQHYRDEWVQNDDQWHGAQHPALDILEESDPPKAFLDSVLEIDVNRAPGEEHDEGDELD